MNLWVAVFLGGGLGSVTRFGVSYLTTSRFTKINPEGTLISNILATLILGIALYYFHEKDSLSTGMKAFIVTGFCGGFSTFSTFSYETIELIKQHNYTYGIANILVSVLLAGLVLYFISKWAA